MSADTQVFDYIVVGAGSAGVPLATRLSEDPAAGVLLIEAGSEPVDPEAISTPHLWPTIWTTPADWGYETEPGQGTAGRRHPYPRGKTLGGSSAINAMVFLRGDPSCYDDWESKGARGWGFDSVLPSFKRSETVVGGDPVFRGSDGPLRPAPAAAPNPISDAFVTACTEAGHAKVYDFNSGPLEGAGLHELNIVHNCRQSVSDAYLTTEVLERPKLEILSGSRVLRLSFEGNRCSGVEVWDGSSARELKATEVILCSGAIDSPRLLMLSGIGPASHLTEVGIEVLLDLPAVGQNLQDHQLCPVVYEATRTVPPPSANLAEASLFWRSRLTSVGCDLQIMFHHIPVAPSSTLSVPDNGCTFAIGNMRPDSVGSIWLRSGSYDDHPVISPNYCSEVTDIDRLIDGIDTARELAASTAFADWGLRETQPGPSRTTRDDLERFVRQAVGPYFHACGTCRMGSDADAVVDPELRVNGIDGLRIADASIMPRIVNSNTHAPAVMIGEHAAALIRGEVSSPSMPLAK